MRVIILMLLLSVVSFTGAQAAEVKMKAGSVGIYQKVGKSNTLKIPSYKVQSLSRRLKTPQMKGMNGARLVRPGTTRKSLGLGYKGKSFSIQGGAKSAGDWDGLNE